MSRMLAAALLATAALPASASAATFTFSYAAAAGTISGTLTGTLLDANTVAVDAITATAFDGVAGPALPWLATANSLYGGDRAPTVTFDGSFVDFAACETEWCESGEGIIFDPDTIDFFSAVVRTTAAFGDIGLVDPDLGPEEEYFDPAKWTLAAVAVPEPMSWMSMIAGFGLIGAGFRRRSLLAQAI